MSFHCVYNNSNISLLFLCYDISNFHVYILFHNSWISTPKSCNWSYEITLKFDISNPSDTSDHMWSLRWFQFTTNIQNLEIMSPVKPLRIRFTIMIWSKEFKSIIIYIKVLSKWFRSQTPSGRDHLTVDLSQGQFSTSTFLTKFRIKNFLFK